MHLIQTFPSLAIFIIILHKPIFISSQTVESTRTPIQYVHHQFTGDNNGINEGTIVGPTTSTEYAKNMVLNNLIEHPLEVSKRNIFSRLSICHFS